MSGWGGKGGRLMDEIASKQAWEAEVAELKRPQRACPGCGVGHQLRFISLDVFAQKDGAEPVEIADVRDHGSVHIFRDRGAGRLGLEVMFHCDAFGRTPILAIGKDISWACVGDRADGA
jgi:hypothetical protein